MDEASPKHGTQELPIDAGLGDASLIESEKENEIEKERLERERAAALAAEAAAKVKAKQDEIRQWASDYFTDFATDLLAYLDDKSLTQKDPATYVANQLSTTKRLAKFSTREQLADGWRKAMAKGAPVGYVESVISGNAQAGTKAQLSIGGLNGNGTAARNGQPLGANMGRHRTTQPGSIYDLEM